MTNRDRFLACLNGVFTPSVAILPLRARDISPNHSACGSIGGDPDGNRKLRIGRE